MCRKTLLASALALLLSPGLQAASLLDVYQDAVQQDAELAVERSRLEQARAQISQANSFLLPQVTASGTWSQVDMDGATDTQENTNLTISAQQALFNAEAWFGRQAANQSFSAAEARFRDTEQNLLLRVAEAYFNVLRAEDNLRSSQAEEQAIKRQLDQAQEQYEVGLISITGVLEARAAHDGARAARIGAEGALMISYEDLEQITGQRYEQINLLNPELPVSAPVPNDRDAWVSMALDSSLTLQAARAGLLASQQNLRSRQARHLPTVALFGEYSKDSDRLNAAGGDNQTLVGVRGTLEIYGGGRTSAQIREGSAALDEARSSEELARRQVLQQTRSLFTQVNTDVLTVQARAQAIRSAESALEATRTGYEVGTRNIVDVLNAERTLWAARRDHDAARYNYVVNQLRLKRVAGTLSETDLRELNRWLVTAAN
ncbi:TolC family outer membrane protein [Marinospirillum alkaliphilum]|uniref:Outer membrane protein n=1 Tax=Marinospirillum alkaliphilum DSM 21637 TaxID=1122209 RepID=A0A1K1XXJ1_9GAMM|nr:TolC family outer membrane protein [Marinospirillum alkaliphilum]SFX54206.1 outer membrane protein [Marinospirillum alkaliphilum DSM 21637]